MNSQAVEIVGIESAEMEELAEIRMADDCYIKELYVQDDSLVIMYTRRNPVLMRMDITILQRLYEYACV